MVRASSREFTGSTETPLAAIVTTRNGKAFFGGG
jgi:hypothetical protein